jgi:serine/threonine protein kinase
MMPHSDLFSLISGSPHERLDENQARMVFRQVAKGVRHLHRRNFVHRDIKPEVTPASLSLLLCVLMV